jgi:NAD(P)-dependent dehydrogenase (short-subunit alcohol dehydrogenase family)
MKTSSQRTASTPSYPLILIRELLPLMGTVASTDVLPTNPTRPPIPKSLDPAGLHNQCLLARRRLRLAAVFRLPRILRKTPHHVHTNMSKAALNMITETEAAACWHDRCVCMNSVDPGYNERSARVWEEWERAAGVGGWRWAGSVACCGWVGEAGGFEWERWEGRLGKVLEASSSVEVGWGKVFDTIAWWRNGWGLCFKHTQYFRDRWPWFGVSEYTSIQS